MISIQIQKNGSVNLEIPNYHCFNRGDPCCSTIKVHTSGLHQENRNDSMETIYRRDTIETDVSHEESKS